MVRSILGVIVGYLAMAVFVVASFIAATALLGPDLVYKPGLYEPSTLWIILSIALSLLGAFLGGMACHAIARSMTAAYWFAGIVVLLGIALAIPAMRSREPPPPRTGDPDPAVLREGTTPLAVAIATAFVAGAGIVAGAFVLARRRIASAAA